MVVRQLVPPATTSSRKVTVRVPPQLSLKADGFIAALSVVSVLKEQLAVLAIMVSAGRV